MATSRRPHEGHAKGEASPEEPLTTQEAAEAMNRFKSLTRALINVPRAKIEAEQKRYNESRPKRRQKARSGRSG